MYFLPSCLLDCLDLALEAFLDNPLKGRCISLQVDPHLLRRELTQVGRVGRLYLLCCIAEVAYHGRLCGLCRCSDVVLGTTGPSAWRSIRWSGLLRYRATRFAPSLF